MSMLGRVMLIGKIQPTLSRLFDAYQDERAKVEMSVGELGLDEAAKVLPEEIAKMEAAFRDAISTNVDVIAACIVLVIDNTLRLYAKSEGVNRWRYGSIVSVNGRNVTAMGALLRAAANAARHHSGEPFTEPTEEVITLLGVTERDESVPRRLLDIAGIYNVQRAIAEIDVACEGMERKDREPKK